MKTFQKITRLWASAPLDETGQRQPALDLPHYTMKNLIMGPGIYFFLAIILITSFEANGQSIDNGKTYPIYKVGAQLVEDFDDDGVEIVRIEYDLVFSSKETFRQLSSEWEYTIIGFADGGVKDLDIKVYQYDDLLEQWEEVAEDNSIDSYAIVSLQPETSGLHKVEVIVYEFHDGYSAAKYGLMFVHD